MISFFTGMKAGAGRLAAAVAAAVAVAVASFGLQGCAMFRSSGANVDEYGWDDGDVLPAADADAVSEAAASVPAEQREQDAAQPAVAANGEDGATNASDDAAKAADGNAGVFDAEESVTAINKFNPVIGPGYRLKVMVMVGDRKEVGPIEVMVSEKEEITLPLLGRVPCGGLTIDALHSRLSGRYAEFFADPEVDVSFAYSDDGISPYGQVLVQGRVHREGWVNIPPTRNLRLSHAIQRSGGFSSSALRSSVRVTRRLDDGTTAVFKVNFKEIGKKGALENDIILEPNDVIYVDESNF